MEGKSYCIRHLNLDDNGYRIEILFKEGLSSFLETNVQTLHVLNDPEYDFMHKEVGKMLIDQEMGTFRFILRMIPFLIKLLKR